MESMNLRQKRSLASMPFVLLALGGLWGCESPPPTTTASVFDYIRNAASGARVRRLESQAQSYVDKLLQLRAAITLAHKPIAALSSTQSLWPVDSPKWRDAKALQQRIKEIQDWRKDKPSASKTKKPEAKKPGATPPKSRALLLDEYEAWLRKVPLKGVGAGWYQRVKKTLHLRQSERHYQSLAIELLALHQLAARTWKQTRKGASPTKEGRLAWKKSWQKFHAKLEASHRAKILRTLAALPRQEARRKSAIQEKKAMRKKGIQGVVMQRSYRHLEMEIHYLDRMITSGRKVKQNEQKAQAAELKRRRDWPAQLAAMKARIRALEARLRFDPARAVKKLGEEQEALRLRFKEIEQRLLDLEAEKKRIQAQLAAFAPGARPAARPAAKAPTPRLPAISRPVPASLPARR